MIMITLLHYDCYDIYIYIYIYIHRERERHVYIYIYIYVRGNHLSNTCVLEMQRITQ